ncbi:hypothetical protein QBC33DRAFT_554362 [Phialemonium atrogriseum]|uniref:SWIM-type domain-containing protein n=1 Tax=Phialemonium atrogriseum TaxID=1093897 RepID=A0AAJ0CB82_9PEZI|nr:uncharacterized protein QBC33DRAFT_554362 [Phialemonium atrogriseum]KAK1772922.1 hypothetical protein QBC33DRAFT_554362 [Phialemonium atrogriseum]
MATLPQPRELLTSLINSISDIPLSQPRPANDQPGREEEPFHPLRAVPISHRHLLTTLHVLFPTLLLPALDLLDRGLVTRLVLEGGGRPTITEDQDGPGPGAPKGTYVVRSARSAHPHPHPHPRRQHQQQTTTPAGAGSGAYVARLGAWNCTCAAFAFAAFPTTGVSRPDSDGGGLDPPNDDGPRWSFGGMSFDGRVGKGEGEGDVPCCKHLLACLLAERWQAALGSYMVERRVGREEMAGIIADV